MLHTKILQNYSFNYASKQNRNAIISICIHITYFKNIFNNNKYLTVYVNNRNNKKVLYTFAQQIAL